MSVINLKRRPRRNRKTQNVRDLLCETNLTPSNFIAPFFLKEGKMVKEPVANMPGIYKWSLDLLLKEIDKIIELGINAIAIFPIIDQSLKDIYGSFSTNPTNPVCLAIKTIKEEFPDLCVVSDVALDPYTSHGHDGIINNKGFVLNDETVRILGEIAVLHAEMGVDFVAPSDMMDGRVAYIRDKLDKSGFCETSIMSYSVKFASVFYGPFRETLKSHPFIGDKKNYQINPSNVKEAVLEAILDEEEGADILMVKPAMFYLDVISVIKRKVKLPLAAFQVSGEYAMICSSAQQGWVSKEAAFYESLISIKRAGADIIFSYAAPFICRMLKDYY